MYIALYIALFLSLTLCVYAMEFQSGAALYSLWGIQIISTRCCCVYFIYFMC